MFAGSYYVKRGLPSINDWITCLNQTYKNYDEIKNKREKCLEFVKQFDWDVIIPQWDKKINDLVNKPKMRMI
jgi:glycosyltransferase involved in cell wall biosynthesis